MKYVLDMKEFCQKVPHSDEKNYNEIFYRYRIEDAYGTLVALVWFTQMVDSGNIYSVSVSLKKEYLRDCFDIYITNGIESREFYPVRFEMVVKSERLTVEKYHPYIYALAEGYTTAQTIMDIFKDGEHLRKHREG